MKLAISRDGLARPCESLDQLGRASNTFLHRIVGPTIELSRLSRPKTVTIIAAAKSGRIPLSLVCRTTGAVIINHLNKIYKMPTEIALGTIANIPDRPRKPLPRHQSVVMFNLSRPGFHNYPLKMRG
jgi:hypothetical protein